MVLDMFCHWNYVLREPLRSGRGGHRQGGHPHPRALGRAGRNATTATADDAAYGDLRARGRHRSRRSTPPGRSASTAASWSSSRSTAPTARPSPGCSAAGSSTASVRRSRCGTPTCRPTEDFRAQWEQIPDNAEFANGFRAQWEQFLRRRRRRPAARLRPRRRRPRTAAGRRRPDAPRPRAAGSRSRASPDDRHAPTAGRPARSRRRLARDRAQRAARLGRAPGAATQPGRPSPPRTSWPTRAARTCPARRPSSTGTPRSPSGAHLFRHGFGVAEAMDTAQRGMGLDWAGDPGAHHAAAPRVATEHGARIASGAGTDHLRRRRPPASTR